MSKKYTIVSDFFLTPPYYQGQIVERSYALAEIGEFDFVIIERVIDASIANSEKYIAYADTDADFEPQNCVPELGKCLGECEIQF